MTDLIQAVLAIMLSLPPTHSELRIETPAERASRLQPLAEVYVEDVLPNGGPAEVAALIAIGYGESTFALYVRDNCSWRPPGSVGNCDNGLSRSYYQLKESVCEPLFADDIDVSSKETLKTATRCALSHYRFSKSVCKSAVRAFPKYGGRGCSDFTSRTLEKVRLYRALVPKLQKAIAEEKASKP